ncbi:hypothetical protein HRI_002714100 [Hibiscus trionum]|uniref:Reverse transcriptase domain-containing protein n=1 Tax=Hibiscus trionum TaxID=183268 RepID=A0A9W7I7M5_HIBTR|nr:hypothetical protein HRI_002714100 [Hibiscus trionum]
MGFAIDWIDCVFRCLSTVTYTVVLNGILGERFLPSRGLRQGDPLDPFLFLVCSKGLSSFLRQGSVGNRVHGFRINRYALEITHLLFADDSLIFGEATTRGASNLKQLLQEYSECSGQLINYDKSRLFFSSNVHDDNHADVKHVLNVDHTSCLDKYFGLPSIVGQNKREAFQHLLERVHSRVSNWCAHPLSQGGKEVFIKFVLQAIPVYAMSVFLLPNTLCRDLERVLAKF